ncbi:hypothetical protein AGLY_015892 [Aphis glycines]|uniref:Uncharacterized protein n=1 Tax=Aphis glycines TaxID=307491 RepID=A0A6G0T0E3_APHGL|nr:hypothetical protein AGLY_015892 [Aphis glycines]
MVLLVLDSSIEETIISGSTFSIEPRSIYYNNMAITYKQYNRIVNDLSHLGGNSIKATIERIVNKLFTDVLLSNFLFTVSFDALKNQTNAKNIDQNEMKERLKYHLAQAPFSFYDIQELIYRHSRGHLRTENIVGCVQTWPKKRWRNTINLPANYCWRLPRQRLAVSSVFRLRPGSAASQTLASEVASAVVVQQTAKEKADRATSPVAFEHRSALRRSGTERFPRA